jgi:hypothetical protein
MTTGPRRALSHVGGQTQAGGQAESAKVLAAALAAVTDADHDVLTHGFHSYPARMHYMVARTIIDAWGEPGHKVLDPFCGSGTVLIEARRAGLEATGIDLNPVACRVAQVKVDRRGRAAIERFEETAAAVVAASLSRVDKRVETRAPVTGEERQWYPPHVLRELAGLHAEIVAVESKEDRDALLVVLSAIAVKFSRQRADTSDARVEPRVGKGAPSRFFGRKASELAQRWGSLASEVVAKSPRAVVREGDVRDLTTLAIRRGPYDLVLTSPPYGGTYDYVEHHERRYPWLGVSAKALRARELGARRNLAATGPGVTARWDEEVGAMLTGMASVATPAGRIVLLVGDGNVAQRRVDAVEQLQRLSGAAGLRVVAWATQPRPDFIGGPLRAEHLVLLRR